VAAKEVVVSTLGVLFQAENPDDINSGTLVSKLQNARYSDGHNKYKPLFTKVTAFAFLMFILLYFPCVATVAAVKNESGNWRWAAFLVVYTTSIAWIIAFLVNQIGNLFFNL
jgi:ferrous iron transport protein B